jgi:hypothetical protein
MEKQEAAEYKERRQRLHTRMHQAHTSRVAKALSSQWPAHTGVTRHDIAAASFFATGCALISSFWLAQPARLSTEDAVGSTCSNIDGQAHGSEHAGSSPRETAVALTQANGVRAALRVDVTSAVQRSMVEGPTGSAFSLAMPPTALTGSAPATTDFGSSRLQALGSGATL